MVKTKESNVDDFDVFHKILIRFDHACINYTTLDHACINYTTFDHARINYTKFARQFRD